MDSSIVDELKAVIDVLSFFKAREKAYRKDLDYFIEKWKYIHQPFEPLKRLEHEVMFLCIELYSLHQGISKKKSLYSKIIKQNAKQFTKIDKDPTVTFENTIFLGVLGSNGFEDLSLENKKDFTNAANKEAIQSKKTTKETVGIMPHGSEDMDVWIDNIIDPEALEKLSTYRNDFAHRLDNLENLKRELTVHQPDQIGEILDVVAMIVEKYTRCFQNILGYTISCGYEGLDGILFDSISRIQEWNQHNQPEN